MYALTAGISVKSVFIAGLLPGLIRVGIVSSWAVWQGRNHSISNHKFNIRNAMHELNTAKWEIIIPFFILFGIWLYYLFVAFSKSRINQFSKSTLIFFTPLRLKSDSSTFTEHIKH